MDRHTNIVDAGNNSKNLLTGKYRTLAALATLAVAGFCAQPSMAAVVGTCKGGAHFATIQDAVNHAPNGGTVSVCPGTYAEQVSITKNLVMNGAVNGTSDYIEIVPPTTGMVANTTDLFDGSPVAAQIVVSGAGVTGGINVNLNNLTIDGINNQITGCGPDLMGIYYQDASGTVNHVVTRNQALSADLNGCQSGEGIFVESGYSVPGVAKVDILNSSVHGYQKNGITADGTGTNVSISGNYIVGQGPTTGAAENGIQISDGATGSVLNNKVIDDVYSPATTGASGILVYDSGSLTIQSNTVSDTQYGIVVFSDGVVDADNNTITNNSVSATHLDDGIDICSNGNTVKSNVVIGSDLSGIHIDSSCQEESNPTGNNNTVTNNTVDEACAGVLLGSGSGNTSSPNSTFNVFDTTYAGDACPAGTGGFTANGVRQDSSSGKRSTKLLPQRHR